MKRTTRHILLSVLICAALATILAACNKPVSVRVNFIVGNDVYATVDTVNDNVIVMPPDPTAEGLEFDGWYWDETTWQRPFTANSLLDVPLSGSDYYVYAKWKQPAAAQGQNIAGPAEAKIVSAPDYTFDGMHGTLSVGNNTETYSFIGQIQVSQNAAWQLSTDIYGRETVPTKTVPLAVGDNVFYLMVTSENGETLTLYTLNVRRRPIYTLTFNVGGGTPVAAIEAEEDTVVTAPQTTRTGYTFAGWDFDFTGPVTASATVTAAWTANTYTVSYNANGGTVSPSQATVTYDAAFTLPTPVKEGHTFEGWYFGSTLVENGTWHYAQNITLFAVWSVNSYTLTLQKSIAAAGTVTGGGLKQYGASVTVGMTGTNNGYTWIGWCSTAGQLLSTAPQYTFTMGLDTTLVATWIAVPVTLACSPTGGGTISGMPNSTYAGQSVTVSAVTHLGYNWQGWYRGGQLVSTAETYTFTVPDDPADAFTLTAQWQLRGEMQNFVFTSTATTCTLLGISDKTVTSVALPEYLTAIGADAFTGCSALHTVYIPEGVSSIGVRAFYGCGALRYLYFGGQTETWNTVVKGANWDANTGNYSLYCTDEDITEDNFN